MKKSLQKYIAVLVFAIMIYNIISPSYFVSAEDNVLDKLRYINDWVIDIENKYIYAIRPSSSWNGKSYDDTLIIVDTSEFNIVKEAELGGNATDIEMYGNKLYFTLIDENKIVEYDILTKSISNEIAVEEKPFSLSAYNGKIFYGTKMGHDSSIYVYDILKKTNEKIIVKDENSVRSYYNPEVSIDKNTGILYTSDIYLHGIDTNNYNIVYESKESDGGKHILIEGSHVFYGHNNYDISLNMIHGKYTFNEEQSPILSVEKITNVLHVNDKYVFTERAIFNRHNFVKVKDLTFEASHVITDINYVYMYDRDGKRIVREKITSLEGNSNTKWSGKELTEWVLDEERGYIYGVSEHENRLLFINKDTLEIEDELIIFSAPSDIELEDGKLYIPLSGSNKVTIIDIDTRSVYKNIITDYRPHKLEKYGEKIYYTEEGLAPIHEYDLTNGSEKSFVANSNRFISKIYRDAQIVIDNDKGIIYVGTDDLHAIDLKNYSLLSSTTDHDRHISGGWPNKLLIQGDEIFYRRTRVDKNNMHTKGIYDENIVFVKDDYVLSTSSIYDRNSFLKMGDIHFKPFSALIDSNNIIYYHDRFTDSIKKIDLKSIPLEKPVNYYNSEAELPVGMQIKNWMYNEENDCIYAISSTSGKLLTIDPKNLTIKNERYVGEKPLDMDIYNNKIYITLKGESKIAIIEDMHRGKISKISTDVTPHKIQVDNRNIYYTGGYFNDSYSQKLYAYDKEKKYSYNIGDQIYRDSDLLIDRDNEILYIGNDGDKKLIVLSTNDYTVVKEHKNSSHNSNENQLFKNDEYIFWGKFKVKISDMTSVVLNDNRVLHVNGKYAYTKKGIHSYEIRSQIVDFPFDANLVLTSDEGEVYLYKYTNNTIYKYPSKYEIDIKINGSLKIDLNDKDQFVFSWDEVPNAIGYNLWYGKYNNRWVSKVAGNSHIIKDNYYVSTRNFTGNGYRVASFGVTPIMKEFSYEMLKIDMKDIDIEKFVSIKKGTSSDKYVEDNSIDLDLISAYHTGLDGNGASSTIFEVNENLFDYSIEKLDNDIDSFELNTDLDNDRFHLEFEAGLYHNLYEKQKDKKLEINTPTGKYIWPIASINLSEVTVNPKTSSIDIDIKREMGKDLDNIINDMFNLNLDIIGEPIGFKIEGLTEEGKLSINTFGKDDFQCWIPLEEEPDKSEIVGMFYDLENRKYHHVPIKFHRDSEGKWWAIFNQNENGGYVLVRQSAIFKDMKNHWAEDDINLLASKLIVKGMPDGRFMPDENITRAQYIALLVRALGLNSSNNSSESFKDIDEDDWYAGAVETAIDLGIVKGYQDGTFQPNKPISREEMSALIVRVLNLLEGGKTEVDEDILKSFKDLSDIDSWAKESTAIAVESGLIKGDEKGYFNPKDYATRAQSGVVVKRLLEKVELIEE